MIIQLLVIATMYYFGFLALLKVNLPKEPKLALAMLANILCITALIDVLRISR